MISTIKQILSRLDSCKRRFYLQKILNGLLILVIFMGVSILLFSLIECRAYFSVLIKTAIAGALCLCTLLLLAWYIAIPFLKFLGLTKGISHKSIAKRIGKHYNEIDDRLTNVLELNDQYEENNTPLLLASIEQKINEFKFVQFEKVFKRIPEKRVLLAALSTTVLVIAFFLLIPSLQASFSRLADYNTPYSPQPPFTFVSQTDNFQVRKGDSFTVSVSIEGEEVESPVYVVLGSEKYVMNKDENGAYNYSFQGVNNDFCFVYQLEEFFSEKYCVEALAVPQVRNFKLEVIPPSYTRVDKSILENVGSVSTPVGSTLKWNFQTSDTDSLWIVFNDSIKAQGNKQDNRFIISNVVTYSQRYSLSVKNVNFTEEAFVDYQITTISDEIPSIAVQGAQDSLYLNRFYYRGEVKDDYGFSRLRCVFRDQDEKDSLVALPISRNVVDHVFFYGIDFNTMPGKSYEYWFEVFDNDKVNGNKKAESEHFTFLKPDERDIKEKRDSNLDKIEQLAKETEEITKSLQEDLMDLRMKQINGSMSDWEKQKSVSEINQKRQDLEDVLKEMDQLNKEMNRFEDSFSEQEKEIMEKQQQIQDLVEDLFSEDLQKMMDDFNKMLEEFDQNKMKDQLQDMSQEMDMGLEELNDRLERSLNHLKKLQVEKEMNRLSDELQKLGQEEENLAQQNLSKEEIQQQADQHKEDFDQLMNDYKEAIEKNEDLKNNFSLDEMKEEQQSVREKLEENSSSGSNDSKRKKQKRASEAGKQMQQMAQKMQAMVQEGNSMQALANINDLKLILDNVIRFSFDQEELLNETENMTSMSPNVVEVQRIQRTLIDRKHTFTDSIKSLADRSEQVASVVNENLSDLESNLNLAMEHFAEGRFSTVRKHQQYAITKSNDLALFLSELIQQMEDMMENAQPGSGEGDRQQQQQGSGSSQDMQSLKQAQEALKKQLEQMMEQMQKGQEKPSKSSFGKALQQQEMMQNMVKKMMEGGEVGSDTHEHLKKVDQMLQQLGNELSDGVMNRNILKRQDMIFNQLLKAENAEMERGEEDERESKQGDEELISKPAELYFQKDSVKPMLIKPEEKSYQFTPFYERIFRDFKEKLQQDK